MLYYFDGIQIYFSFVVLLYLNTQVRYLVRDNEGSLSVQMYWPGPHYHYKEVAWARAMFSVQLQYTNSEVCTDKFCTYRKSDGGGVGGHKAARGTRSQTRSSGTSPATSLFQNFGMNYLLVVHKCDGRGSRILLRQYISLVL